MVNPVYARLAREDHGKMTAAARASDNHPANMARWLRLAREASPDAADDEIAVRAAELRREFYRRMTDAGRAARARNKAGQRAEEQRQQAEARLAEHIKAVVGQAPPLTAEQRLKLAALLIGPAA